uniref:Uncharacterized protein n=1 Tax=Encephalitozoon cuniculi TaxID=6035 RepID=M1K9R6_ENCCN|nr:hypothetical protein ECU01_1340 [Encephalitozoon cuniculi]
MDFLKFFLNALVAHDSGNKVRTDTREHGGAYLGTSTNLNREILYEGFISIDSMVFISEMNQFSRELLEEFIRKTVFVAKELLFEDPSAFSRFNSCLEKSDYTEEKLRNALELRNQYFNSDKSMIGKELSMEKYKALISRTNGKLPRLHYEDKDEEYLRMMERLINSKHEDDGIHKAIRRETAEFYSDRAEIPKSLVLDSRISLSIGGSVFAPGILVDLIKKLNVPNISELINRMIPRLLAPSEELISRMHLKSFTEKKSLVVDFLYSCLERRDGPFKEKIDRAFEERTKILEVYLKGDPRAQQKLQVLDKLQEDEINKLIFVFRNVEEDGLVFRIDRPVVEAYISLLEDAQRPAKEALYNLFME